MDYFIDEVAWYWWGIDYFFQNITVEWDNQGRIGIG